VPYFGEKKGGDENDWYGKSVNIPGFEWWGEDEIKDN
jgi:hypothetical protein